MSVHEAYSEWAANYDSDRNLTRDLDQIVTRDTLAQHHFHTILELGCGTGKNTVLYADLAERVCSLDFTEGMIKQAKDKVHRHNVGFAVADMTRRWPVADQKADLAVCNLVLEHIEDLGFIFSEAHRVTAAHGHFFICELHPFRQYQGKKAVYQRDQQQTEIPAFIHHISDFLNAAAHAGFVLESLKESWHEADQGQPPRLVSFMFVKAS